MPSFSSSMGRLLAFFLFSATLPAQSSSLFEWKPVNIQGMGYVTGLLAGANNKLIAKTDVGGVYLWNSAQQRWDWITSSIEFRGAHSIDVESIALDPNRPTRIYAAFPRPKPFTTPWNSTNYTYPGEILYTDDNGRTWTPTALATLDIAMAGNGNYRTSTGERLMVDPNRADLVYFASRTQGLFRRDLATTGSSWTQLTTGLPSPTTLDDGSTGDAGGRAGFTFIAFDNRNLPASSPTQRLYTGAYGSGVYTSANGGQSWTLMADATSRNRYPMRGQVSSDGALWVAFAASNNQPALRRYDPASQTWSDVTVSGGVITSVDALTLDPTNPNRLAIGGQFAGRGRSAILITRDPSTGAYTARPQTILRTPDTNITDGVIASNQPDYYFNEAASGPAALAFDPSNPARLFQGNGFGVVFSDDVNVATPTWSWRMKGFEELVSTSVRVPQSGPVQLFSSHMDMIGFRHMNRDQVPTMADKIAPYGHKVNPEYVVGTGLNWWVPFDTYTAPRWPDGHVASALGLDISGRKPDFIAFTGTHNWTAPWGISGYSSNGGASWQPFPSIPTERMWVTRYIEQNNNWVPEDVDREVKAIGGVIAVGADIAPGQTFPNMIWSPKTMGGTDRLTATAGWQYIAYNTTFGRLYYFDPTTQTWKRSVLRTPDPRPADSGDANQRNNYRFFDSPPLSWANHFIGGPAAIPYNYANIVAADRVDPNLFYYLSDAGSSTRPNAWARLFASTDGGKTFDEIFYNFESISGDASITWGPRPQLVPHPTRRGELWICFGNNVDFSSSSPAFKAVLNGNTWTVTRVTTLANAVFVGFGKGNEGGPAAIYARGRAYGMSRDAILQSLDDGLTWRAISDPTQDNFAGSQGLEGDMRTPNLVYIWSAGRGVSYGTLPTATSPQTRYDFESSIAGWEVVGANRTINATLARSTTAAYSGAGSLEINFVGLRAANQTLLIRVDPGSNQSAPGKQITFRVKVPTTVVMTVNAFVQDANWGWTAATIGPRDANGWATATVTVPANAVTPLNRLGIAITFSGAWSGKLHLDAISW